MTLDTRSRSTTELFDLTRHRALRFHIEQSFLFASKAPLIDISLDDLTSASRRLPVIFHRDGAGRLLLSQVLHTPTFSAITPRGGWQARGVVPSLLRVYPFRWTTTAAGSKLTVVPSAPHFRGPGQVLVTSKAKPTRLLRQIMDEVGRIQQAFQTTAALLQELDAAQLLKPAALEVVANGRVIQMPIERVEPSCDVTELSPELVRLVKLHQRSLSRHTLSSLSPDSGRGDSPSTPKAETTEDPGLSLCLGFCSRHQVDLEALRSRKRQPELTALRQALATDAMQQGCLEAVASVLQRSPATLKGWLETGKKQ